MTDLLAPLGVLAMLIAWGAARHARRRKLQHQANLLGAPWSITPVAESAVPLGLADLAVTRLGHTRRVRTAYVSNDPTVEATIIEYAFDSGFGDARRQFAVTIVTQSGAPGVAPMVITHSPLIAAAAEFPGSVTHAFDGRYWVSEDADEIERFKNTLSRAESPEPPDRTVERRPGLWAAYESGPATPARALELMRSLATRRAALESSAPGASSPRS